MRKQSVFGQFHVSTGRAVALAICMTLCALGMSVTANAQDPSGATIITFDAPGAATANSPVCAPFCGTVAYGNNNPGAIVGFYTDANVVPHGFLRKPDGRIISFDAPGAGLGAGLNQGTAAYAITDQGTIVGQYQDPNFVFHGFVRHRDGSFTTFDAPSAGTGANQGTLAWDINGAGTTAGTYIDGNGVNHGFLRLRSGQITSFDPPGSVYTYPCEETCLSPDGTITGFYLDSSNAYHGFVRTPDGKITTIDAPGAATGGFAGTIAASIAAGAITGYFVGAKNLAHGFLRARDGTFTTFDVPGARNTFAFSLNASRTITGLYGVNLVSHGFTRFRDGSFATFEAPGSGSVGPLRGTRPSTNNQQGAVTGWFWDANGLAHGFLWIPGARGVSPQAP